MTTRDWRSNAKKVAVAVPVLVGVTAVSWAMGAVLMTTVALGSWKYARWKDR